MRNLTLFDRESLSLSEQEMSYPALNIAQYAKSLSLAGAVGMRIDQRPWPEVFNKHYLEPDLVIT
ncbi:MAG: hypothetical protein R3F37_02155 [Candidatus Competibacteraceae bacterium]